MKKYHNETFITHFVCELEELFELEKDTTKDNASYTKLLQIEDKIKDLLRKHYLCF